MNHTDETVSDLFLEDLADELEGHGEVLRWRKMGYAFFLFNTNATGEEECFKTYGLSAGQILEIAGELLGNLDPNEALLALAIMEKKILDEKR